jgi:hypothetical protein
MIHHRPATPAACRRQRKSAQSDDDMIELGESTWFRGVPAHAEEGTVALGLGEDVRIIIREQDVRAVTKDGGSYGVAVSSDANVLLRIEKAVKARLRPEYGRHTQVRSVDIERILGGGRDCRARWSSPAGGKRLSRVAQGGNSPNSNRLYVWRYRRNVLSNWS